MAAFPLTPVPSSVSVPAITDPVLRFATDSGYELRRPKRSRPLRRFTVEWLGKTTNEMHVIRDFLMTTRMGAIPFQWLHLTGIDFVSVFNTSPVLLAYVHGLFTGQMVFVTNATPNTAINGLWPITRIDENQLTLDGTVAGGQGTATVQVYLPMAVAQFNEDTWASPVKLIGPESNYDVNDPTHGRGRFNFTIDVQEIF